VSNGNMMASLKRQPGGAWSIKARGYYTKNTKTYSLMVPIIKQVIQNNYD
jgi:hypothetical protein